MSQADSNTNRANLGLFGPDTDCTIMSCHNVAAFMADALDALAESPFDFSEAGRHGAGSIMREMAEALEMERQRLEEETVRGRRDGMHAAREQKAAGGGA